MKKLALFLLSLFLCSLVHADNLKENRVVMKDILKVVASDIEKNYYDTNLHGLQWAQLVEEARQKIDKAQTVNEMEAAIYDLAEHLEDSHTFFIPPLGATEAKYGFEAKPFGNEVRVYEITPKGAAEKAGLMLGDHIVAIQGVGLDRSNNERMFIYGRLLYMASPLSLEIERDGATKKIDVTPKLIKRPIVQDPFKRFGDIWSLVLEAESEDLKHPYQYGMMNGVGYMKLREFPQEGGDFLRGIADQVQNAKALILDLRNCPGGSVESMASFEGMFEEQEVEIASMVGRKKTEPLKIKPTKPRLRVPIFILVDSETASAAEVVAYQLQKNKKAVLLGDDTAGMVIVAKSFEGSVGAGNSVDFVTNVGISRLVFPGDVVLEGRSLKPDVPCIPTQKEMRDKSDTCLAKALELAQKAAGN